MKALFAAALLLFTLLQAHAATYTFRSDSYAWESAATAVTWDRACTNFPGDDDKATLTFTGGFKFRFAGTDYTSVRVLANGGLQFPSADNGFYRSFSNTALPASANNTSGSGCPATAPTHTVLAYWTDLNPSQQGSGGVTWQQKGTAPNRYVVVSWNGVYQYNTSTPYTFQVILYESASGVNGEFKFQYGNANASGSRATIGVQVDASDYTQYSYNSGYNANGSAIRWFVASGTPTRRAEYRFDEYGYSGRVGEAADSSGNSNNGVRAGSDITTSATGRACRSLNVPADATAATQAVDTLLNVSSSLGNAGALTFWYAANAAWNSGPAMLADATLQAAQPFFLMRQADGSLRATLTDSAGTTLTATTAALAHAAGSWQHVAVSWRLAAGTNQSSIRIYIGGTQVGVINGTTNGTLNAGLGTLFVGDNRSAAAPTGGTANSASGFIDEMRVYNYDISAVELTADRNATHVCPPPLDHVEAVPAATSGSTCAPSTITVRACSDPACATVMTGYVGRVALSTSSDRGVWAIASGGGSGALTPPVPANDGDASYTFSAADQGVARLTLSHSLAQNVTLTAVDSATPSTATTSAAIQFRDNAFVWEEDAAGSIAGANVAVAGRPHDLRVSLIKRNPSNNNSCGVATDFTGNRAVKLWRTDTGGPWTAPGAQITVGAVTTTSAIGASRPATTATLPFTAGVATLNLTTTDVGNYAFTIEDDTRQYAATTISGSSAALTVRPFVIGIGGIVMGGTANPGKGGSGEAKFGAAGAPFSATLTAYRWSNAAGGANGLPLAGATLANVASGGVAAGFNAPVTLGLLAGSQTPAGGTLGTLANGAIIGGFSGGALTVGNLAYSEVGSAQLSTAQVVANYLGNADADVGALVFNAAGGQETRLGRFVPAGFDVSGFAVTHRSSMGCSPASTFSYMGEGMNFRFTLTARNAAGAPTLNYTGDFAKFSPTDTLGINLAGISGTTMFKHGGRMTTAFGSGTWSNGVVNVSMTANGQRGLTPDGPHPNAQFGIAPVDSDGVGMRTLNLDTDYPADVADRALLGQVPLRYGRLRLQNAMSAANRPLRLPLTAQYWDSSTATFQTNDLDSCTRITSANLSFGNLRRTLTTADAVMSPASVTVDATRPVFITLALPGGGRVGSMDVAIALGSNTADASCMSWTPAVTATAGANLNAMRGAWCGASSALRDPSARATWGLTRGADGVVFQRENY